MDLEFTINEQICRIVDKRQQSVDLSENYLVLSFTFSDDWADTGKFVLYPMPDGTVLRQRINNNKSVVPADVLVGDKFYFTVYGINNNERITTNLVKVNLLKSGFTDDAITPGEDQVTPSVVEEIYLALDGKVANTTFDEEVEQIGETFTNIQTELDNKSDTGHTHLMEDITDLPPFYTKNEVDNLIHNIQNSIQFKLAKNIIQTDETLQMTVQVKKDGFPSINETVNIYGDD